MSALPLGLDNALFDGACAVFLMACALTATLATYFNASGVERRLREAAIVRQLDSRVPLQSIPTRAAYVLAQARAGLLPMLAPLLVPLLLSQIARVLAQQYYPDYVDEAQFCGAILGALLLLSLVSLLPSTSVTLKAKMCFCSSTIFSDSLRLVPKFLPCLDVFLPL